VESGLVVLVRRFDRGRPDRPVFTGNRLWCIAVFVEFRRHHVHQKVVAMHEFNFRVDVRRARTRIMFYGRLPPVHRRCPACETSRPRGHTDLRLGDEAGRQMYPPNERDGDDNQWQHDDQVLVLENHRQDVTQVELPLFPSRYFLVLPGPRLLHAAPLLPLNRS